MHFHPYLLKVLGYYLKIYYIVYCELHNGEGALSSG